MSKRCAGPPVMSAKAYLADALQLIDNFQASRGTGAGKKRQRVDDGVQQSSSALIADAAAAAAAAALSPVEMLERGLEMLVTLIEVQGAHLLPSCEAISRRLTALLPNRVDPTVHSPLLWRAIACLCTWYGASASKVLAEVLELSLEAAPKNTTSPGASDDAQHPTPAAGATTSGLSTSPIVAYFGDLVSMSVVAEAITAAGRFLSSHLLQVFAQRLAHDLYADMLQIQRKAVVVSPASVDQMMMMDAFLLNSAQMTLALLLVCRPIPAIVLTLAHCTNQVVPLASRTPPPQQHPATRPTASSSLRHVMHQVQAVAQLIVMPEALPWYIPPADAVAHPQPPPPPSHAHVVAVQQQQHHPVASSSDAVATHRQRSQGRSPRALGPMHPALAAPSPAPVSSPRPATVASPSSSLRGHQNLTASPASRNAKQRASPAARPNNTPKQHKAHTTTDHDDMPDIVLD